MAGGSGGDILAGKIGTDMIFGDEVSLDSNGFPQANPYYFAGSSTDTVDYTGAAGFGTLLKAGVQIELASAVNGPNVGQAVSHGDPPDPTNPMSLPNPDIVAAVENIIGSPWADVIVGSDDDFPTSAPPTPTPSMSTATTSPAPAALVPTVALTTSWSAAPCRHALRRLRPGWPRRRRLQRQHPRRRRCGQW